MRREVVILAALLAAWEVGLAWVGDERFLARFAGGKDRAELSASEGGAPAASGGRRLAAAGAGRASTLRLAVAPLDPARDHLIRIQAAPGPEFTLQLIDRAPQKPVRTWSFPARARPLDRFLPFEGAALPASHRFQIWLGRPEPLEITAFEVRALEPGWRPIRRIVAWLGPLLLVGFVARHRRSAAGFFRRAPAGPPRRPDGAWDAVAAIALILAGAHLYLAAPVQQLLDAKYSTAVSQRLVTAGTLSLPAELAQVDPERLPYQLQQVDGRLFHVYPDAVAVLNAPIVAGYALRGVAPLEAGSFFRRHDELRILRFAAAVQAAALCALLYLVGRLYLAPGPALALSALFAAGTPITSSISRAYWSHAWAALLLTGALYLLLHPGLRARRWVPPAAATLLAWAFFCRPPVSLSILAIVAFLWVTSRDRLPSLVAAGAAWAGLFVAYSMWNFDTPIPRYFLAQHLESGVLGLETLQRSYVRALAGTLVSPSRGLFVFVPFFLLILLGVALFWRRLRDRPLAAAALVSIGATWQLLAANRVWFGGQCFGPRLFSDVVPWFFLLAALVLASARGAETAGGRRAATAALILLAAAASIFVNVRGATARATISWSGHSFWDWRHPQFLAGLGEEPEPATFEERLAAAPTTRDPAARRRLLDEVLTSPSVERRSVDGRSMIAAGVTFDRWTYGTRPAALVVVNDGPRPLEATVRLAAWAPEDAYPIEVRIDDGDTTRRVTLGSPGFERVGLGTVEPGSSRLYLVWSDTAWSPGGRDRRQLGVQLLAAAD